MPKHAPGTPVQQTALRVLGCIAAGLCLAVFVSAFTFNVEAGSFTGFLSKGLRAFFLSGRTLAAWAVFSVVAYPVMFHGKAAGGFLFKYRWLIACGVVAIGVALDVSGSSLGAYSDYIGSNGDVLLGTSRPVRSDEWAVNVPLAISQSIAESPFPYENDIFRATATNMFLVGGQATWDFSTLFRPFFWGYLVLGMERGLSFFWVGRAVMLFMASFELGYRFLTRESKALALCYALLVTFAGAVQWWFAVAGLVDMLAFGQIALVWGQSYLRTESYAKRALFALGIAWCLCIYVFALYPAWQVAYGYVFLAMLVALLVKELPRSRRSWRDVVIILVALALMAASIASVLLHASEAVRIVSSTAYPGARLETGGGEGRALLWYPLSLVAPISDSGVVPNASVTSSYFTAFPLCFLLPVYVMVRSRRCDSLLVALLAVTAFLALYVAVGVPELIARLTLLSNSQAVRAVCGCEFGMVAMLFASLSKCGASLEDKVALPVLCAASAVVATIGILTCIGMELIAHAYMFMVAVTLAFFACVACTPFRFGKASIIAACLVVAILTGMLVNPVTVGAYSKFQETPLKELVESSNEPGDVWVAVDVDYKHANAIAALGAKTLNTTNVYPQLATWEKLDPNREYEDIYNRYAHPFVSLKDEGDPTFELRYVDDFLLRCTADDLVKIGATKLFSGNDGLEAYSTENAVIEKIGESANGYFAYEIAAS